MNAATARKQARMLRDCLVDSDEWLSPQAAVLSPQATCRIAEAIVGAEGAYRQTVAAGLAAIGILRSGIADGRLQLSRKELQWLDRLEREISALPQNEQDLLPEMAHAAS
jgi:methanol--5-hydroxybenzimidazolylcobamide Co-methyltransferase